MALGRTRGRMSSAVGQRASQQRATAQQSSPEAFHQALNRKMESIPEVRALKSFGASISNRQPTEQELQKLQSLQTAVQNSAAFKAIERANRAFQTQNQQRMQAQNAPRTLPQQAQKVPNLVAAPQKPAAVPTQRVTQAQLGPQNSAPAGSMSSQADAMAKQMLAAQNKANAAQNKNTQGSFMDYAAQRVMQQTPSLAMPVQGRSSMDAQSMRAMEAAPRAPQKTFSQPVSSSPASMAPPKETAPRAAQVPVPQTQPKPTPDMSAIAAPAVLSPEQRKAVMRGEKVTAPPAMRKGGAVKKKPGYAKGGMVMANCGASMKPQQKRKK